MSAKQFGSIHEGSVGPDGVHPSPGSMLTPRIQLCMFPFKKACPVIPLPLRDIYLRMSGIVLIYGYRIAVYGFSILNGKRS